MIEHYAPDADDRPAVRAEAQADTSDGEARVVHAHHLGDPCNPDCVTYEPEEGDGET